MSIGIHVAKISHVLTGSNKTRKTMVDAIKKDTTELKLGAVQIFVQGPRSSKMNPMDYDEIKKYCTDNKIAVYVHSSYISVGIFSVDSVNKNTPKSKNAIKTILTQFEACEKLGSKGLVIHLAKRTPEQIIDTLSVLIPLIKNFNTPLLLEQPAKKPHPTQTYETSEKMNNITKLILTKFPKYTNWGFCIDTVHLFSAGIDMDKYTAVKKWFKDLKNPYIKLFHCNGGSIDIYGTGADKHIIPFSYDDDIWGDDVLDENDNKKFNITQLKKSSISIITQFAKKNNADIILEINRGSYSDSKFAIDTIQKLL